MKGKRKRYPEKYKEFASYEAFRKNPYVDGLTGIGVAFLRPKEEMLVPMYSKDGFPVKAKTEGGEMQVGIKYSGSNVTIDRRQYAKMYIEFIGLLIKEGIGLPAVRMLFFILKKLKVGSDVVRFTVLAAKAHTGYKADKSIYEGLVDLIKMGVIARKEGTEEEYFINPQYIFRGKRDKLLDDGVEIE